MDRTRALGAEALGTFWLVLGGCGSAVLAAAFPGTSASASSACRSPSASPWSRGPTPWATSPAATSTRRSRGSVGRQEVPRQGRGPVHRRPGPRRHRWPRCAPVGIPRVSPASSAPALAGRQRLRRPPRPAGTPSARRSSPRSCITAVFLLVILGVDRPAGPGRLRPPRHRPRPHPDPPHQHPGDQHVGEPGPLAPARRCSSAAALEQLWFFWLAPIVGAVIGAVIHRFIAGDTAGTAEIS